MQWGFKFVMPGLVPGMTSCGSGSKKDLDGRNKPGHDKARIFSSYSARAISARFEGTLL
jgi:hypothetical protein